MKACFGFGHRIVFENISGKLDKAIEGAVSQGCEIFYTGAMGEFAIYFLPLFAKQRKPIHT